MNFLDAINLTTTPDAIATCPACLSPFKKKQDDHKYCSRRCGAFASSRRCKGKRAQYNKTCACCGDKIQHRGNRFCSPACNSRYQTRISRGRPGKDKACICVICQLPIPGRIIKKYCSAACCKIGQQLNAAKIEAPFTKQRFKHEAAA